MAALAMRYDEEKSDEAVPGLSYLTSFEECGIARACKGNDWGALDRLHAQGLIDDPRSRNKSIAFTPEDLSRAKAMCQQLFAVESAQSLR